jgi:hypothetical protein
VVAPAKSFFSSRPPSPSRLERKAWSLSEPLLGIIWLNDDDDNADTVPDGTDGVVNGAADLVRLYPVFLDIKQLVTVLPPGNGITYKLKQEENALNFVYTNLTRATAFSYTAGTLTTGFGPAFDQAASAASVQQIMAAGVDLFTGSPAFLDAIQNQSGGLLLIEGRQLTDKPLVLSVEKDGNVITELKLELSTMRIGTFWETANKANQVFNPTAKDDPWGGDGYGGYGTEQNGAPRNMVFLVPDPQDNKYKVTLEVGVPASGGAGFIAAAYVGETKVANSDKAVMPDGKCELAFEHLGTSKDIEDFAIRVGYDANSSGTLDPAEIIKLAVKTYGEPTVRGTKGSKYNSAKGTIDGIISGSITSVGTGIFLPHAKRFLQIFRDGFVDNPSFPEDKRPTSSSTVSFDAFNGYFAEWLTHNSGAPFNDAGVADITEYTWGPLTSAADLVATSPQIEDPLSAFYLSTVRPLATSYFASLPVGSSAYFPSAAGTFYDIPHTHESLAWVPATTVTFDRSWLYDKLDDVNGTIGRGRLLSHQARYRVEKQLVVYDNPEGLPLIVEELVVTQVLSQGAVIDLYDFNHLTGSAGQDAATLQIGYGKGAYGADRNRGKIYRDRIEFAKIHTSLP